MTSYRSIKEYDGHESKFRYHSPNTQPGKVLKFVKKLLEHNERNVIKEASNGSTWSALWTDDPMDTYGLLQEMYEKKRKPGMCNVYVYIVYILIWGSGF